MQWLRDGLKMIRYGRRDRKAGRLAVPDAGGVYFVPAFVGLGAPYWNHRARGTIVGLTRGTTAAHIARAALDSMAYQSREVLDAMQQDSGTPLAVLKVDGGAAANNLLMQFQSDVLGVNVQRPVVQETTALGAAYLAGLAVGFWKDQEDVRRNWALDRRIQAGDGGGQAGTALHALEEGRRPLARLGGLGARSVSVANEPTRTREMALRRRFVAGTDGSPTTA